MGFAILWKMELQFYGKMLCNFREKCLAKNSYLLQDKNGESCKTKMEKVAIGNSIKLQNPVMSPYH
jgi:hypothetical protein